ncbi:MAG: NAD(P)H-dependent oxidoreductase [Spirochaetales bacterium]|nr:NAD(P)H-dependent oxidoreductase [Spirochaetales bacterium]
MKYTVIYDCPDSQGQDILDYLMKNSSDKVRFFNIADEERQPCAGCFGCWIKTPGACIYKDGLDAVQREDFGSDRVLFLCPVTWGGYSPALKLYLDRSICRVLPFLVSHRGETHHPPRYEHNPQLFLAGYGSSLSTEESELFKKIGENLDDNLSSNSLNTAVLSVGGDYSFLDGFLNDAMEAAS